MPGDPESRLKVRLRLIGRRASVSPSRDQAGTDRPGSALILVIYSVAAGPFKWRSFPFLFASIFGVGASEIAIREQVSFACLFCYIVKMCGIAGIVGLENVEEAESRIRRMTDSLAHRGPDAEGTFFNESVALGHRRLSVIDLHESANQPLFDQSARYSIIFNGEVYNYREIRKSLPDYPFRTKSDTEAVLAAFLKDGPDCLNFLNGMFAFAIWDDRRRELFIARDRLGVKPLYYSVTPGGSLVFASEIRSVLASGLIPRTLDLPGLSDYLMFQSVYAPGTIVKNIFQLEAGGYATFSDSRLNTGSYWRIENAGEGGFDDSPEETRKNLRELMLQAVERRMVSDVPLGSFLSGGIDSSAVVGLMAEVSTSPVNTFSVIFGEKQFDESVFSGLIAKRFNTHHTPITLSPDDLLRDLPSALRAADSPSGDGINTFVVSRAVKNKGITVALSGIGGDELFAGYPNFDHWIRIQRSRALRLPSAVRRILAQPYSRSGNSKYQRIGDLISAGDRRLPAVYPLLRQIFSKKYSKKLLPGIDPPLTFAKTLEARDAKIRRFPLLSQYSIAELLGYTQNVLLKDTDQFSSASALEVREPLLDYRLVEYVLRVPDLLKFPRYPKSLLVESLSGLLPDEIVHRKKMGFTLPWEQWMRNELRPLCDQSLQRLAERGILDSRLLLEKWTGFQSGGRGLLWSQFWPLVVLSAWLDQNEF